MKHLSLWSISVVALAAWITSPVAKAQNITWGSAGEITGDGDLIDSSTSPGAVTYDAFLTNRTDTTPITVDGVTFNSTIIGGDASQFTQTDGIISYTILTDPAGTGNLAYSFANSFPTTSPSSQAFANLLDAGGVYEDASPNVAGGSGTVTISGLTIGDTYAVQVFNFADDGDAGNNVLSSTGGNSVTFSNLDIDPTSNVNQGQFVTGTFTADSSSETFDWNGAGDSSQFTPLGPINVANITAVPEPSMNALLLIGGLAAFVFCFCRRYRALRNGDPDQAQRA